jgi:hypothetical protein
VARHAQRPPAKRVDPAPSGWALGGVAFGGTILILAGAFQFLSGLAAVLDDGLYPRVSNYAYDVDVTTWGWIHMIVGVAVGLTGAAVFTRRLIGVIAGVMIAGLGALVNFFFIPVYPFWALVLVGLHVWVIWSLTRPGVVVDD